MLFTEFVSMVWSTAAESDRQASWNPSGISWTIWLLYYDPLFAQQMFLPRYVPVWTFKAPAEIIGVLM